MFYIAPTAENRRILREHADEAMASYSGMMSWLIVNKSGSLRILWEPQGQTEYVGRDVVIAATGGFEKSHGDGAVISPDTGKPYKTQKAYLKDLLGDQYASIFKPSKPGEKSCK